MENEHAVLLEIWLIISLAKFEMRLHTGFTMLWLILYKFILKSMHILKKKSHEAENSQQKGMEVASTFIALNLIIYDTDLPGWKDEA